MYVSDITLGDEYVLITTNIQDEIYTKKKKLHITEYDINL